MKRTIPEQLDDAKDGAEFAQVLHGLFGALEAAKDAEDDE